MWMLQQADILVDGSDMDLVSFDDSEQFEEEDSVCSWISETDQVLNWSGWKRSSTSIDVEEKGVDNEDVQVFTLIFFNSLKSACFYHNPGFLFIPLNKLLSKVDIILKLLYIHIIIILDATLNMHHFV